jgi:hypothetical protein
MGIEPTLEAWEAAVLPLNYTRFATYWHALYEMPLRTQDCGDTHYNIRHGNPAQRPA